MYYKVRVVEHVYKVKDDKQTLWDTKVYNVVVESDKKMARFVAKDAVIDMPTNYGDGYTIKIKSGKVWSTTDEVGVYEPEEKEVYRDENWRETVKEMM